MRYAILLLSSLLLFPSYCWSAINSVSGNITDGSTVTLSGTGFGTKTQAAPIQWDNFEAGTVGAVIQTPTIGTTWGNPEDVRYTSSVTRTGSARSSLHDFTTAGVYNQALIKDGGTWGSLFISFWYRTDYGSLTAYNGFPSRNYKIFRVEGDNGTKTGDQGIGVPIVSYEKRGVGTAPGALEIALRAQYSPTLQEGTFYGSSIAWAHQQWNKVEMYLNVVDGQKDIKVYENGVDVSPSKSSSGWTNCFSPYMGGDNSRFNEIHLGEYFSRDNGASANLYMDDVYIDTSLQRVELCSGSSWANRGACEIQPATSWSETSVAVTLNTGAFTTGTTAYLYVTDGAGDSSPLGSPVEIGGSGGEDDTTPPVRSLLAPSGALAAGTTSTTESFVTDEAAICRASNTAGTPYAEMTLEFSSAYAMSHSRTATGLTNGSSYNRYVRCIDGTGNANTTDAVISYSVASSAGTAGTLSWEYSTYSAERSDVRIPINIVRTGGSTGIVTAQWSSNGQTALHDVDYYGNDNVTVTFADGVTTMPINTYGSGADGIEMIANGADDDRYFQMILSNPTGGATLGTTLATVTIEGDYVAPIPGARVGVGSMRVGVGSTPITPVQ